MPMSPKQAEARNRWNKEHLRTVTLNIKKEFLPPFEEYAETHGLTLAQTFITLAEFQLNIRQRTFWQKLKFAFSFCEKRHKGDKKDEIL